LTSPRLLAVELLPEKFQNRRPIVDGSEVEKKKPRKAKERRENWTNTR
jgi:hypothetical protein